MAAKAFSSVVRPHYASRLFFGATAVGVGAFAMTRPVFAESDKTKKAAKHSEKAAKPSAKKQSAWEQLKAKIPDDEHNPCKPLLEKALQSRDQKSVDSFIKCMTAEVDKWVKENTGLMKQAVEEGDAALSEDEKEQLNAIRQRLGTSEEDGGQGEEDAAEGGEGAEGGEDEEAGEESRTHPLWLPAKDQAEPEKHPAPGSPKDKAVDKAEGRASKPAAPAKADKKEESKPEKKEDKKPEKKEEKKPEKEDKKPEKKEEKKPEKKEEKKPEKEEKKPEKKEDKKADKKEEKKDAKAGKKEAH